MYFLKPSCPSQKGDPDIFFFKYIQDIRNDFFSPVHVAGKRHFPASFRTSCALQWDRHDSLPGRKRSSARLRRILSQRTARSFASETTRCSRISIPAEKTTTLKKIAIHTITDNLFLPFSPFSFSLHLLIAALHTDMTRKTVLLH